MIFRSFFVLGVLGQRDPVTGPRANQRTARLRGAPLPGRPQRPPGPGRRAAAARRRAAGAGHQGDHAAPDALDRFRGVEVRRWLWGGGRGMFFFFFFFFFFFSFFCFFNRSFPPSRMGLKWIRFGLRLQQA